MKTSKKLCALVLSFVLAFACMAVIPFTGITTEAAGTTYVAKINYAKADTWTYLMIETPIPTGTYQFDVDYATTGSVSARVIIPTGSIPATEIDRTDDGRHITVQFDWTYNGSTAFQIRLRDDDFKGTGVIYFANPVLKRVENGVLTGDNEVWDYSKQYSEIGSSITKSWAWRGEWYRTNTASNITVEADSAGRFPSQDGLATTATTKAVYIGQCASGSCQAATVFIPLTSKSSGSYALQDKCTVEFTCKVKVLSGTKPVVGFLRTTDYPTSSQYRTASPTNWVDNTTATLVGDTLTVRFKLDDIPADRNCYKSETRDYNGGKYSPNVTIGSGGIWGGLTIGNTAFNGNWSRQPDFTGSYIISEPSLKAVLDKDGNDVTASNGEMLTGFDTYNNAGIYGLAGRQYVGAGTDAMNHPWRAPANKWSILGNNPDLVKFVTVDDSYVTARRAYVCNRETSNTRQYYTCAAFGNKKFERFGIGCYSVIPDDVNKKAVIIGNDGTNKLANIYLPLFTHRYFQCVGKSDGNYDWRDGYSNGTNGGNVFYHISFKAKRLSGNGQPTLGRLYAGDWCWNDSGFRVGTNAAYNGSGDATAQASNCTSSYNATTGEFTAVVRFNKGYFYQLTQNGYNEVLTIGNAEHASSGYDTDNRDSSFAISDISIQVYDADNSTLLDAEAAPQMVAGNYWFDPDPNTIDDHTSQHYYEEGLSNHNGRPTALYNMPIDTWGCDGSQAMISVVDRSDCLANNHTLDYHAATSTKMEYWSCSTCRASYADPYASEPVGNDVNAVNKMILVKASGSQGVNALLPLCMNSSAGTHYYKFTCDMMVFGDSPAPTISVLQGSWWGGNGAISTDGWSNNSSTPSNNLYTTYNATTHKFEAVIRIDHSASTLAYSNALTGAYAAILLGNVRHVGAGGSTDTKYDTAFAFSNPQLYELTSASNPNSTTGSNLAAPVTDKTLNFGANYVGTTEQRYGTENTMCHANNPLAAPLGKWSIDGFASWISSEDIPTDFFAGRAVSLKSAQLQLDGSMSLGFNLYPTSQLISDANAYVRITDNRGSTDIPLANAEDKTGGVYLFRYPLMVKQFDTTVNLKVYNGSGQLAAMYSTKGNDYTASGLDYSVEEYANKKEESGSTAAMRELAGAIKDFGAATKIYLNYGDTSGLSVSSASTGITLSSVESYKSTRTGNKPTGITETSIQLNLIEKTTLRIKFKSTKNSGYNFTIDGSPVHAELLADGAYWLEVPNIEAKDLGTAHAFAVSDGVNTYTVNASAMTYARASIANGNTERQNLGKAITRYYNAAAAYFS